MARALRADVAVLWLGEMLLIPHLWPIVDALAKARPDLRIDMWVSTSVHEALIRSWMTADHANVALRRAPGFRHVAAFEPGQNPELPSKIPMLLRLWPSIRKARVVLCAEQTSLWLAKLSWGPRFIFTIHGSGPLNQGPGRRLHAAYRLLIPSEGDQAIHTASGLDPRRMIVTGYVKASCVPSRTRADLFADDRPILLYTPHWQEYRSSWWAWGRQVVDQLVDQRAFNVILAPHQRLFERDPEALAVLERAGRAAHVHVDSGSFAMVDGSYTAMADLYLGDTSSQLLEFIARPRPCVFLSPPGMSWRQMDGGQYDACGIVVKRIENLAAALSQAMATHGGYRDFQRGFAAATLGDTSGAAPANAAAAIEAALL